VAVNVHLWPRSQFSGVVKPITDVCTLKMAEDGLSASSASCMVHPELCNKPPCLFIVDGPSICNPSSLGLGSKTVVPFMVL
jgi:hypothetical protein